MVTLFTIKVLGFGLKVWLKHRKERCVSSSRGGKSVHESLFDVAAFLAYDQIYVGDFRAHFYEGLANQRFFEMACHDQTSIFNCV